MANFFDGVGDVIKSVTGVTDYEIERKRIAQQQQYLDSLNRPKEDNSKTIIAIIIIAIVSILGLVVFLVKKRSI